MFQWFCIRETICKVLMSIVCLLLIVYCQWKRGKRLDQRKNVSKEEWLNVKMIREVA